MVFGFALGDLLKWTRSSLLFFFIYKLKRLEHKDTGLSDPMEALRC